MKTLNEVIKERLEAEGEARKELARQRKKEQEQIRQKEAMAREDARVLIQRLAGFTLDGWTCEASLNTTGDQADYFGLYLACGTEHSHFEHRVVFEGVTQNSVLVIEHEGQARLVDFKLVASHIVNSSGACTSKRFDDLLDALIYARYGDVFGLVGQGFFDRAGELLQGLNGAAGQ